MTVLLFSGKIIHLSRSQFHQCKIDRLDNWQSNQFNHSVVSDSLWPHGLMYARFPFHHQFLELTQTHIHWVGDAIQSFHPLSSPSSPAFNLSEHEIFSNESESICPEFENCFIPFLGYRVPERWWWLFLFHWYYCGSCCFLFSCPQVPPWSWLFPKF